jgi:hypothetical protein
MDKKSENVKQEKKVKLVFFLENFFLTYLGLTLNFILFPMQLTTSFFSFFCSRFIFFVSSRIVSGNLSLSSRDLNLHSSENYMTTKS